MWRASANTSIVLKFLRFQETTALQWCNKSTSSVAGGVVGPVRLL